MLNFGLKEGGNVETPWYGVSAIDYWSFVGWVLDIHSPMPDGWCLEFVISCRKKSANDTGGHERRKIKKRIKTNGSCAIGIIRGRCFNLFHQQHTLNGRKVVGLQAVDVHARRQIAAVEDHFVNTGRFVTGQQLLHLPTVHIEYG